jgi:hypothetical protein
MTTYHFIDDDDTQVEPWLGSADWDRVLPESARELAKIDRRVAQLELIADLIVSQYPPYDDFDDSPQYVASDQEIRAAKRVAFGNGLTGQDIADFAPPKYSGNPSPGGLKTHCKNGHRLYGANVRISIRGSRRCVTCTERKSRDESKAKAKS